jgi:cation/acetate symporter
VKRWASHDLYARVFRRGRTSERQEVLVSKCAAVSISLLSMGLAVLFENQNIAFMVGLVFAIAASANFPVILLSIVWPDLTTRGAVSGSIAGLLSSVGLVALSPGVWTATLKLGSAPFPYDNPALVSVPLAFAISWAVSVLDRSAAAASVRAAFSAQHVRAQTGLGIE